MIRLLILVILLAGCSDPDIIYDCSSVDHASMVKAYSACVLNADNTGRQFCAINTKQLLCTSKYHND